jgi:GTP pyrophosphokinase
VLVDDVVDCYKALGVIHSLYKPAPHIGLSDFIAQPKPNGYQSIHTRVFGNGGIIEIQIRTYLMHEAAEHGLAAHWAYSEAKFKKGVSDKLIKSGQVSTKGEKLEWVRQLLQWQKEVVDSQEFIERVKFDALGHRIFAFSPKGDVYDLPLGATPIDYAFAVHSDLGRYIKAAKVNGKMVSLNHPVDSGDIIEIIKSKNERALNRDWLRFAVTNVAKREITKELRKT